MSEQTPLMKQYQGIKEEHTDAIVLFRLGDFYEMFYEDAKIASAILQIALTTRDKNKENPVPMCGIPYFASESYIAKLIKAGHKVAVCEQVEDPKDAKGIVKREVVRVITPGTHIPASPKENSYIMGIAPAGDAHGVALADVSTGEFLLYETDRPIEDELSRFEPLEVVIPQGASEDIHYAEALRGYYVSPVDDWAFEYQEAYKLLLGHFRVSSLGGFGCDEMKDAISAAGALLGYLLETQKEGLFFRKLTPLNQAGFMFLDTPTQRNLELIRNLKDSSNEGTLLWALDETLTPMGGRFLRNALLRPLLDIGEMRKRHRAVSFLVEDYELIDVLRRHLRTIQDLERLAHKLDTRKANARDLVALKTSLSHVPKIKAALSRALDETLKGAIGEGLAELPELCSLIEKAIDDHPPLSVKDGGIIKRGFNAEVDELRNMSLNAKDLIASIEAKEKKETGISSLKVGYNKVFGYYIEVTKANLDTVPERYIRKQTLVGGERFITEELKEYETKVLGAEERGKPLEHEVFSGVLEEADRHVPGIRRNSELLAFTDFLVSLAVAAKRHNYAMPRMVEDKTLDITGGRHPVLERNIERERFIPNDTSIDGQKRTMLVITGPNMAGKSTYMRQVALIVLMAQVGGFVPADEATIGVVDRIFTRIGASDFISKGQSTFMVEMIETANILNNATERSLILLDEVGRGTSTFDGISIAWATAEHIVKKVGARTMFATHYNELTELSGSVQGTRNMNIAVKEWGDEIIFLRKIEDGPADKSYGIHVARLAGLPVDVLKRAREVLERLERQQMSGGAGGGNQLELFTPREQAFIAELAGIDADGVTPEEAMKLLLELKEKAKGLS